MSFHTERHVKAIRKPAHCYACGHTIEIGQPAIRWAGLTDGDFGTLAYHPDCRAAEITWNAMRDNNSDEWDGLENMEWDDYPWLLETYPEIAARKGITAETVRKNQEEFSRRWRR